MSVVVWTFTAAPGASHMYPHSRRRSRILARVCRVLRAVGNGVSASAGIYSAVTGTSRQPPPLHPTPTVSRVYGNRIFYPTLVPPQPASLPTPDISHPFSTILSHTFLAIYPPFVAAMPHSRRTGVSGIMILSRFMVKVTTDSNDGERRLHYQSHDGDIL